MTTITASRLGELLSLADDLASQIDEFGFTINTVQISPGFGASDFICFQLDGEHHTSTLVGLLVDLDCADISDVQYSGLTDVRGKRHGVEVKVYARQAVTA